MRQGQIEWLRAKFREVKRPPKESVTDLVARLRAKAISCELGNVLQDNLLEKSRIGVQKKTIRERITADSRRAI